MVQWLMAVQACPFPEYPLLQVQLNVPGPVEVQVDPTAQLLIPKVQLFMGVQAYPVPLYPLLQVHVNISVAVELQVDPVALVAISAKSAIAGEIRSACAAVGPRANVGAGRSKNGTVVDPIGAIVDRCIRLRPKNEMIPSPQTEMLEQE